MTEVLSQAEIDELLTAINAGDTEPKDFRPASDYRKIKIYDFKRPDKFSKEQIRTVAIMHETFARSATTMLSSYFRMMVHVHVASVDQLTYEEFIRSIPTPTTLPIVDMYPLPGKAVLEIDPVITGMMINRLFGGDGIARQKCHELTDIERLALKEVLGNIVSAFKKAWEYIFPLSPSIDQVETNPQFIQAVPPSEMAVLVTLETKIGDAEGMMNICIPYITLESIMPRLSAAFWYGRDNGEQGAVRRQGSGQVNISDIPILIKAELFSRVCTMDEILRWRKRTVLYPHDKMNLEKCVIKIGDYIVFGAESVKNFDIYSRKIRVEKLLKPYKECFMDNKTEQLGEFDTPGIGSALKDVNIQVSVELGRTRRMIKEILSMGEGTIVELDKLAGEPVDILANNVLIAKGEVVVIDENFGVRVTELLNVQKPEKKEKQEQEEPNEKPIFHFF
jgi:flagellar motor switch protein FliM